MKKYTLMMFLGALLSIQSFGQSKTKLKFSLGALYGSASHAGAELNIEILKNTEVLYTNGLMFGIGFTLPLKSDGPYGESYNGIIYQAYPEDVYETGISTDGGLHITAGYRIKRVALAARLGSYTKTYFQNGFNNQMGLYHTSQSEGEYIFYGGFIDIIALKNMGVSVGYDTFNKAMLGVSYRF